MYFKCYCCYYYNFNFINCVLFCVLLFLLLFFLHRLLLLWPREREKKRETAFEFPLPWPKTSLFLSLSVHKCVHILRFLVCGKEILLFLCVVVEYISLRVREIIYCFVRNGAAQVSIHFSLRWFRFSHIGRVTTVPNIGRLLIINV